MGRRLYATAGVYRLDVQVMSDASCLTSAQPRLRVYSYETYSKYSSLHKTLALLQIPLIVCGLVLLSRSLPTTRASAPGTAGLVVNDKWPASELPFHLSLRPFFAGLPAFGVVSSGAVSIVVLACWILYSSGTARRSAGLYVHIGKPLPGGSLGSYGEGPVTVTVRRSGNPARVGQPELQMNSRLVTLAELGDAIRVELCRRGGRAVYLQADTELPWTDVLQAVDAAQQAWPGVPVILVTPARNTVAGR